MTLCHSQETLTESVELLEIGAFGILYSARLTYRRCAILFIIFVIIVGKDRRIACDDLFGLLWLVDLSDLLYSGLNLRLDLLLILFLSFLLRAFFFW